MDQKTPQPDEADALTERRRRILDAAAQCFVRAGFHRTTMQDVAREAGMSPGNLYRYFPSKEEIVAGLAARDRADMGADFARLEMAEDFLADFLDLGRKHFEREPREKSVLCLEIWAEATRSARMAAINSEFDRDLMKRFVWLFREGQRQGAVAPDLDVDAAAYVIHTLADGLLVRRAVAADFAPEREVELVFCVIKAILAGRINFPEPPTASAPDKTSSERTSS